MGKARIRVMLTAEDGRTLTITSGALSLNVGEIIDDVLLAHAEGKPVELTLDWPPSATVEESRVG